VVFLLTIQCFNVVIIHIFQNIKKISEYCGIFTYNIMF